MTPREFLKAIRKTRIRQRVRLAARHVLVDGLSISDSARRAGMTRQAVHAAVRRLERALAETTHTPRGRPRAPHPALPEHWETVTVIVPADTAQLIREAERVAIERIVSPVSPPEAPNG